MKKFRRLISAVIAVMLIVSMCVVGISAVSAAGTKTIYFDNSKTQWTGVYLYQWSVGTTVIELTPVDGADNVYTATIDDAIVKGLFKNTAGTSDWDQQTADVDLTDVDGKIFVPASSANKTSGTWESYGTGDDDETTATTEATGATEPVSGDTKTVYLDASVITQGNERYAAYAFATVGGDAWYDPSGVEDGLYKFEIADNYDKVIFCRMDGETTENSWTNKWDQTEDLTFDGDIYTITGQQTSGSYLLLGEWSTVGDTEPATTEPATTEPETTEPATTDPTEPETTQPETDPVPADTKTVYLDASVITQGNERYAAYAFATVGGDAWYDPSGVEDGLYKFEIADNYDKVIFCRMDGETTENSWTNKWDQTEDLTFDGDIYTITGQQTSGSYLLLGEWSTIGSDEDTYTLYFAAPKTVATRTQWDGAELYYGATSLLSDCDRIALTDTGKYVSVTVDSLKTALSGDWRVYSVTLTESQAALIDAAKKVGFVNAAYDFSKTTSTLNITNGKSVAELDGQIFIIDDAITPSEVAGYTGSFQAFDESYLYTPGSAPVTISFLAPEVADGGIAWEGVELYYGTSSLLSACDRVALEDTGKTVAIDASDLGLSSVVSGDWKLYTVTLTEEQVAAIDSANHIGFVNTACDYVKTTSTLDVTFGSSVSAYDGAVFVVTDSITSVEFNAYTGEWYVLD